MIDFFKRNLLASFVLSLAFLVLFVTIYSLLIADSFSWTSLIILSLSLLGVGLMLSVLLERYPLFTEKTYWVMIVYTLMVSCFPLSFDSPLVYSAAFCVALSLYFLMYSAFAIDTRKGPFMVSFSLACAFLLYAPAGVLVIPMGLELIRLAKISVKDMISFFCGLITPLLLLSAYLLFKGQDVLTFFRQQILCFAAPHFNSEWLNASISELILQGVLALILLLSFVTRWTRRDTGTLLAIARFYETLFLMLLFSLVIMVAYPIYYTSSIPIIIIPASLMVTSFFSRKKGFWIQLLKLLLIGAVAYHYVTQIWFYQ